MVHLFLAEQADNVVDIIKSGVSYTRDDEGFVELDSELVPVPHDDLIDFPWDVGIELRVNLDGIVECFAVLDHCDTEFVWFRVSLT